MKDKIVFIVTFIIVLAGYSCWEYLQEFLLSYYSKKQAEEIAYKFFFYCIELGFVGYTYSVMVAQKDKESIFFRFTRMVFITTVATVFDRFFGDPYKVSTFEYILLIANIISIFINGEKIRAIGNKIRQLREVYRQGFRIFKQ